MNPSVRQGIRRVLAAERVRRGIAVGAAGIMLTSPAFAAEDSRAVMLDEVVVTAQFREEPLQTTPVAITALNRDQLQVLGMTKVTDLAAPNVLFGPGQGTQGPISQILVRGVGQFDGHPGAEPGVAVVIDDVYRGVVLGSAIELIDLDRVEILRGPQGTLAGKNAVGGAVKLFSRKPTEDTDGYVSVGYGEFNRFEVRAAGNMTLVPDKAFLRLSGVSRRKDGYFKRLDYQCVNPGSNVQTSIPVSDDCTLGTLGGEKMQGARLALRLVGESLESNFIVDTTADRPEPPPVKLISIDNPLVPNGSRFITGPEDYTSYATYTNLGFTDPARYTTPTAQPGAGTHAAFSIPTENPIDSYGVSHHLTWRLNQQYALDLISGYRKDEGRYSLWYGGSPFTPQLLLNTWDHAQHTEEVRLGAAFDHVDVTVGAYYYDQKTHFGGLKLLSPGAANETLFVGNDPIPAQSISGFAHAVWRLNSQTSLLTGLRYTDEEKTYTFDRNNPYATNLPSFTPVGVIDGTSGKYSGNKLDYRLGVEQQWTSNMMSYAQVSTGFRGGGINYRPFVAQQVKPFSPETMRAYEVGFKGDWFDRSLRTNLSLFFNQYEDIIFSDTSATVVNGVVISANNSTPINAGDADIYGAELEVRARPIEALQIDATMSYLHFKFTAIGAAGATIPGVTLNTKEPYAPERKATLGVQYEIPVGAVGQLVPRVDASYQADYFTDILNTPAAQIESRTLVNARLTWKAASLDWEGSLAVTNLTDEFYYTNKNRLAPPTNIVEGIPGAPREWVVSFRRFF